MIQIKRLPDGAIIDATTGQDFTSVIRSWTQFRSGEIGGRAKSAKKAEAARANGKLGGRPRKVVQ